MMCSFKNRLWVGRSTEVFVGHRESSHGVQFARDFRRRAEMKEQETNNKNIKAKRAGTAITEVSGPAGMTIDQVPERLDLGHRLVGCCCTL